MKNVPLRGFQHLIGETIKKIDATAINLVTIETESGKLIEICADENHCGIAIVECQRMLSQHNFWR
jgi:hypothetical protein